MIFLQEIFSSAGNKNREINMAYRLKHSVKILWQACLVLAVVLSSCTGLIFDDLEGCEKGVYINFRYDYNLQRADMFADHVGEVTVYVFDENGNYITRQTEANEDGYKPLKENGYAMFVNLPAGKYRFVTLAHQRKYDDLMAEDGAKFVRSEMDENNRMEDLKITLSHQTDAEGRAYIDHQNMPLDTLWHAISDDVVEVARGRYTYHTLSLMRNTKYISVILRNIDASLQMDINDYELYIAGANVRLNHDNSSDPSIKALCTPYAVWNTYDSDTDGRIAVGTMGHADFMTSRIFSHENLSDDEVLVIKNKTTGKEVVKVNLPELLSRLSSYDEINRYSKQEFLDRGYDYDLTFFLSDDSWVYANVSIGILGWTKRVQNVDL